MTNTHAFGYHCPRRPCACVHFCEMLLTEHLRMPYGWLTDGLRKFRPDGTEKKKQQHFRLVLGTLRQQLNSIDDVLADLCKRLYHQSGSILHVWISQKAQMYALD